ncbi:WD40 repeat-like protein [Whalleya microplaca]|nr:WD40 repeat-like protein [Whalleya microplaca]
MALSNSKPPASWKYTPQDISLPADAEDTISSISWSPVANNLAVASWDGKVRVYDIVNGAARGVAMLQAAGPLFSCHWAKDGETIVAAGAEKTAHLLHLPTGQKATIGSHEAPIRAVRFVDIPESNVKYWDLRQQEPLATIRCEERVYSMDAKSDLLVIATAERNIHLVDLHKPTTLLRTLRSPLKEQTRAVSVFPDGKGWGTASIEGRCSINARDKVENSNFDITFRCHRDKPVNGVTKVWTVNDVQFHPVIQTIFTTAGADGIISFWDKVSRSRLSFYAQEGNAITTTGFNRDGSLFAYAVGYDWSMGVCGNNPEIPTKLMLHAVCNRDTKKKR